MEHEADYIEAHEDQSDDKPLNTIRCSDQTTQ